MVSCVWKHVAELDTQTVVSNKDGCVGTDTALFMRKAQPIMTFLVFLCGCSVGPSRCWSAGTAVGGGEGGKQREAGDGCINCVPRCVLLRR
jgi:hypothetical protein